MPSDIITMVFTDLVQSTDVKALLPGEDVRARNQVFLDEILTPHRRRIEASLEAYGGRAVKTLGDAYFLVFADAARAVQWAVAVQRGHATEPIPTPLGPLEVKIGMHTGAPMIDPESPNDFVGNEVDYAARVVALARGGQVLLSEVTAALVRAAGLEGASLHNHGERELKGIGRFPIFELLYNARPPRPLQQAGLGPNNLPPPPEDFFDRFDQRAELDQRLRLGGVTILKGEGGFGKTALALTAVHAALEEGELDGGAAWVSCDGNPRCDECLRQMAAVFFKDRPEGEGGPSTAEAVSQHLRDHKALVILDNFESTDGDPELVRWLADIRPPARVLVTTRQLPPGMRGHVVEVRELPRPDAVALFGKRAAAAGLAATELEEQAPLIGELCAAVGDQPLAIELLAVRAVGLPLSRLLERVERDLTVLDAQGDPTRPDRHQSATDNLSLSYDKLSPAARDFLLRFCEVPDGAEPADVSRAMGTEGWDEAAEELVRMSMLHLENGRYTMSPLTRQFAVEQQSREGGGDGPPTLPLKKLA